MKPLISIIMPVYNCEDFITESINSIITQTYTNWELIIVNDGSVDGTADRIYEIKDSRINLVKLKKHSGLTAAFKEGYKHAKGEYIIRHDGDDTSAQGRLEQQQTFLESNPDIGMVSCLISCFTRDPLFRKDCIFVERIQNYYKSPEEIKKSVLGGFIPILFPTLMIRRSLLDRVMNEGSPPAFDDHLELLLKLIQLAPVCKLNSILYYYRRHNKAYHVLNEREYEKYSSKLLKDIDVKNHLSYPDFYNEINTGQVKKSRLNPDSPAKVLMMIDALNVGGTETHVFNLVKKLIDNGVYVVVATSGGPMEGLFEAYGIKIIKIPIAGDYISNKRKYGLIRLVKAIIDKEGINIIHAHLFASMQLASELYRMYQIPYIVTIHGLFYPNDVLYSSCIEASTVIAVSEPVRKRLNEKLGNRINNKLVVIPNGISLDLLGSMNTNTNVDKELSLTRSTRLLCYCSRLDWNKTDAARTLLFAFSQLFKKYPQLRVVIIGDGTGRPAIEREAQIINEMAGEKVVHLVGAKINVVPYYERSSVVIGTGRVALEAMMCKRPVIAIGNQGYSGIVNEKTSQRQWEMYFGDHDAVEAPNVTNIVKAINYLMESSDRRRRIGSWCRNWCERYFNNDIIVKDIVRIYSKTLRK